MQRMATIFKHTVCKKGSMPMRLWSSSFRLFIMPRSRIRAQDHLWLISYVRIDVPGVALRDFVAVISMFLVQRPCGVVEEHRLGSSWCQDQRSELSILCLRLVSHVWIGVLGVAMRDFIGVIWLFIGAATMHSWGPPPTTQGFDFFQEKEGEARGVSPPSFSWKRNHIYE